MKGLIEGRVVHYIPGEDQMAEQRPDGWTMPWEQNRHYAAIIVKVVDHNKQTVFLAVLSELGVTSPLERIQHFPDIKVAAIPYSNEKTPGTWHWVEKV